MSAKPIWRLFGVLLAFRLVPAHAVLTTVPTDADTYAWSVAADNNFGHSQIGEVGRKPAKSGPVQVFRGLLHFDLSVVPPAAILRAAILRVLVAYTTRDPLNLDLRVWRLAQGFAEGDGMSGVTWNTQPSIISSPVQSAVMNAFAGDWLELDVRALATAARQGGDPNHLWLRIGPTDETTNTDSAFAFCTKEHANGSGGAQLMIDWNLPSATPTAPATPTCTATHTSVAVPSGTPTPSMTATPADSATPIPTLENVVPAKALLWRIILTTDADNPRVVVTGGSGSVDQNASVTVTNTRTHQVSTAPADALGAFTASLDAQPGDGLSITVFDAAGNASPTGLLTVSAMAVRITNPAADTSLPEDRVRVSGVVTNDLNVAVTVNGVSALGENGLFVAPSVPLLAGTNLLTATATNTRGDRATHRVSVGSLAFPALLRLTAAPAIGLAPLTVTFVPEGLASTPPQTLSIDFDGDGNDDVTTSDPALPLATTYATPGIYVARLRVVDSQSTQHEALAGVQVESMTSVDSLIRDLWSDYTAALSAGDRETALTFLTPGAQQAFAPVFETLAPGMPTIVASFSPLQLASLTAGLGEYAINRTIAGHDRIFLIYFQRGFDGVWHLAAM